MSEFEKYRITTMLHLPGNLRTEAELATTLDRVLKDTTFQGEVALTRIGFCVAIAFDLSYEAAREVIEEQGWQFVLPPQVVDLLIEELDHAYKMTAEPLLTALIDALVSGAFRVTGLPTQQPGLIKLDMLLAQRDNIQPDFDKLYKVLENQLYQVGYVIAACRAPIVTLEDLDRYNREHKQ